MANGSTSARSIKIFLASPSDVQSEREALSSLVREINDVLAFLVPGTNLRLELLKYETHTYPDIGQPQEVINNQISSDYDIFVGVMWKRCGTPTASSQSGTIEEFQRALARREKTGRPTIMFYFCDEPVPFPKADDLEQLAEVVRFREELASKGFTLSYPTRAQFRDHVRSGILRAVADLLGDKIPRDHHQPAEAPSILPPDEDRTAVEELAKRYDEVRQGLPSGRGRTAKMSEILAEMRLKAAAVKSLLPEYQKSKSAGLRLAAIGVLQQFPNPSELTWLAERLDPDKEAPFIGHAATVAFAQAVRSLPPSEYPSLEKTIKMALSLAERNPHDPPRIRVLNAALGELNARIISKENGKAKRN